MDQLEFSAFHAAGVPLASAPGCLLRSKSADDMSKATIFVSSTCYDLAALREDLRGFLLQLGHVPLLSEYPSFPVQPDQTAVDNCKKNVETHTDILVLIVGGRRGALDSTV